MTHAYQEIYLSNTQALLGGAFDYAIHARGIAGDSFLKLFSISSVSNRIENDEPAYLSEKSGIETAIDVLVETTGKVPAAKPQVNFSRSKEYWIGWAVAYYQWFSGRKFSDIFLRFSRLKIYSRYIPLFMKRISASSPTLSMAKCVRTLPTPTSIVSAHFMVARRQNFPNEAVLALDRSKCTSSAIKISTKPVQKRSSNLLRFSAVQ